MCLEDTRCLPAICTALTNGERQTMECRHFATFYVVKNLSHKGRRERDLKRLKREQFLSKMSCKRDGLLVFHTVSSPYRMTEQYAASRNLLFFSPEEWAHKEGATSHTLLKRCSLFLEIFFFFFLHPHSVWEVRKWDLSIFLLGNSKICMFV
jgi:hypothetical protein